ncbi:hypothetical protein L202_04102 [Cryptococcus amylolentus CBS 6039]|uniref:NmrA-like domain-containing protein n=1 Tax=Cryptococcus amylolentus CBS 6039 TaxID=1295533 RepID=A0A1E3HRZ6_9TREE|nr:hypothetical protein L202_04102 [Cryptococcus amylolentus CBS 6039]ODN78466.1 hypothetical protein L202_04102 [Cryptococcus amylolentus CBS 6039]
MSFNTPQKILLIGAGELGQSFLKTLAAYPSCRVDLSVLLRPSSSTDLSQYSATVVRGDTTAPISELAALFKPYDTIICAAGFASGPGTQLRLAKAALEAGVPHYLPWQFGVDYDIIGRGSSQPVFDEQLDVRELLRAQSKVKWTIVSTGLFTSFLFEPGFGVVDLKEGVVRALGKWENSVTVTSSDHIANFTAAMLLDTPSPPEGVVFVAGDTVTFRDVAELVEKAGWKVQKEVLTVEVLEEQLRKSPDDVWTKYQLIWARNAGVSWPKESTWNVKEGLGGEALAVPKP